MRHRPVTSVTSASEGLSSEMRGRQAQYLVMMGFRVLCVPLVLLVDGWLMWVFIISAVVLPYIAVILANATRRNRTNDSERVELPHRHALPPADQGERSNHLGQDLSAESRRM